MICSPLLPGTPSVRLWVRDRKESIPYSEVVLLRSTRNYTFFELADGRRVLSSKTLGLHEKQLPDGFVRVHRSYIVNRHFVRYLDRQRRVCTLTTNRRIQVSVRRLRKAASMIDGP